MEETKRGKLGLALGGGGSRAFVHMGVLARLIEAGLAPNCLSGSSMGAVLGAMYAADPRPEAVARISDYFRNSHMFGRLTRQFKGDGLHHRQPGWMGRLARKLATASVATAVSFRLGLRRMHPVNRAVDDLFSLDKRIESLPLPFACNAFILTERVAEEVTAGPVNPALKAGVAIGLVFSPFEWEGRQYADAAPVCPVPVGLCRRLGATVTVAVDICAPLDRPQRSHSGFDVVRRIISVQSETLNTAEITGADVVVRIDASDVFWGDFSHIDALVERGRQAVEPHIAGIRALLSDSGNGI